MTAGLSAAFAKPHPALVTFITAGDGDTAANLDALVAGGADVIELGMPFTDPMADGPAIQLANIRSLNAGTTTADILQIAKDFRARHPAVPLVLMGYANPMTIRGADWFAAACADAGVDGVICVDIPPEEDDSLGPALRDAGIALIRLATPPAISPACPDSERRQRFPLLCLGRGDHRQATGRTGQHRGSRRAPQSRHRPCPSRSVSACAPPNRPPPSRASPMAWWWGRRWSNWWRSMGRMRHNIWSDMLRTSLRQSALHGPNPLPRLS